MSAKADLHPSPPRPSREQLRHILSVAVGSCPRAKPRPVSTYEPLAWLLRDDVVSAATRRTRRVLYRKLVHALARDFERVYSERLTAQNSPWTFQEVYESSERARLCIRSLKWCALKHLCHLPGASDASVQVYGRIMQLLTPSAGPSNA